MAKISITQLYKDDPQNLKAVQKHIDENSDLVINMVDDIVKQCSSELDNYVEYVRSILSDSNHTVTNSILEDITIALPIILYNVNDIEENLGIKEDIAKANKSELYNSIYSSLMTGTVADKTAIAETETQAETMMYVIYQHAHKKIRAKNELGLELLQSVKKVLSKRITELEISKNSIM